MVAKSFAVRRKARSNSRSAWRSAFSAGTTSPERARGSRKGTRRPLRAVSRPPIRVPSCATPPDEMTRRRSVANTKTGSVPLDVILLVEHQHARLNHNDIFVGDGNSINIFPNMDQTFGECTVPSCECNLYPQHHFSLIVDLTPELSHHRLIITIKHRL